MKKKINRK